MLAPTLGMSNKQQFRSDSTPRFFGLVKYRSYGHFAWVSWWLTTPNHGGITQNQRLAQMSLLDYHLYVVLY